MEAPEAGMRLGELNGTPAAFISRTVRTNSILAPLQSNELNPRQPP